VQVDISENSRSGQIDRLNLLADSLQNKGWAMSGFLVCNMTTYNTAFVNDETGPCLDYGHHGNLAEALGERSMDAQLKVSEVTTLACIHTHLIPCTTHCTTHLIH